MSHSWYFDVGHVQESILLESLLIIFPGLLAIGIGFAGEQDVGDIFFGLNQNIAGRRGVAAMPDLAAGVGGGHLAKIIAADDVHAAFEDIRIADAEHTADAAAAGCTGDED